MSHEVPNQNLFQNVSETSHVSWQIDNMDTRLFCASIVKHATDLTLQRHLRLRGQIHMLTHGSGVAHNIVDLHLQL